MKLLKKIFSCTTLKKSIPLKLINLGRSRFENDKLVCVTLISGCAIFLFLCLNVEIISAIIPPVHPSIHLSTFLFIPLFIFIHSINQSDLLSTRFLYLPTSSFFKCLLHLIIFHSFFFSSIHSIIGAFIEYLFTDWLNLQPTEQSIHQS